MHAVPLLSMSSSMCPGQSDRLEHSKGPTSVPATCGSLPLSSMHAFHRDATVAVPLTPNASDTAWHSACVSCAANHAAVSDSGAMLTDAHVSRHAWPHWLGW